LIKKLNEDYIKVKFRCGNFMFKGLMIVEVVYLSRKKLIPFLLVLGIRKIFLKNIN